MPLNGIKSEHPVTTVMRRLTAWFGYLAAIVSFTFILSVTGGDAPVVPSAQNTPDLAQLSQRGRLRVAMSEGYMRWFDGGDGLSGFEHDLLRSFAAQQQLELEVLVVRHPQEALASLARGEVDFAAGSIGQALAVKPGVTTTAPVMYSRYQIVSAPAVATIEQPIQLNGIRVVVEAGSNSIGLLQSLTAESPFTRWSVSKNDSSEMLLARLARGDIDATIVDSRTALMMQHHYPDLRLGYQFPQDHPIVWALPAASNPEIAAAMNDFVESERRHGTLGVLEERYTNPASSQGYLNLLAFRQRVDDTLPRFRHMFVDAASRTDNDWRLLAALSYQESMWDPQAESPTGVQGLMQLTTDTAKFLKVDRNDPAASIDGASRYVSWLRSRLPDSIAEPDRTWLALASYNLGPGHVDDALKLTADNGGNPERWSDVKKVLPLLEDEEVARTTRFGKARGNEALDHVTRVRGFYKVLARLEDKAETQYRAEITGSVFKSPAFVAVTTDGRAVSSSGYSEAGSPDRATMVTAAAPSKSDNPSGVNDTQKNTAWLDADPDAPLTDFSASSLQPAVVPASTLFPAAAPAIRNFQTQHQTIPLRISRLDESEDQ